MGIVDSVEYELDLPNPSEMQNIENQNNTDPSTTKLILTKDDKINERKSWLKRRLHYHPWETKDGKKVRKKLKK